ncbi:MAG: DNA polymerase I [bacterium]|nr:DNA polymerase I [bacterium]
MLNKHKNSTCLIIDGHSLAYRAFYGFPLSLKMPNGQIINAVYGFLSMFLNVLERFEPDYVCVCFDVKEPTFRHNMFPDYKANRPPSPEDFKSQVPVLKDSINRIGIKTLELAGYEADDIIGTIAEKASAGNIHSLIISGDKDTLQLVSDKVSVVMNKKGVSDIIIYNPGTVKNEFRLTPEQIIDLKSLQGDSSDNIPGVSGIGAKTATNLIEQFHSLENIYNNLENIKSDSIKQKLINDKKSAFISYKLASINKNIPIDTEIENLKYNYNLNKIIECLKDFNFNSLVRKFSKKTSMDTTKNIKTETREKEEAEVREKEDLDFCNYKIVDSIPQLKELIPEMSKGFALDIETTSKNIHLSQITGIAIAVRQKEAFYIPLNDFIDNNYQETDHTIPLFTQTISKKRAIKFELNPFLKILKPVLENINIAKFTHNGKYEYNVFKNYHIDLKGIEFDTMLAAYLLYPGQPLGLKALVKHFFNVNLLNFEDVAGKGKKCVTFDQVELETAKNYACADADFTFRLKLLMAPLVKENKLDTLFYDIEMPLQLVLGKMEYEGVCLDVGYLSHLNSIFSKDMKKLQKEVYILAGCEFNLSSPKQLQNVLFNKLGLPATKKTKTGFSTDASVLEKLSLKHKIAQILLEYRELEKLKSTYINAIPLLINDLTNRVHTSFNQTVTATGRLSSSNPNLQNIPVRSENGSKIRKAFIPSVPGNVIMSADYSQIELRIMAEMSKDYHMIQAFNNNEDIHLSTASVVFNSRLEDITREQRNQAKAVNFGIIYGISPYGLAENLKISPKDAKSIIENYFLLFPKIKLFMEASVEFARSNGFVKTLSGRIRPVTDINSPLKNKRQFAERIAVNTRVQGTAADIMKIAMIKIQAQIEKHKMQSKMIVQVHDELIFDVPEPEINALFDIVKDEMESAVNFSIPLSVNISTGNNWQETK